MPDQRKSITPEEIVEVRNEYGITLKPIKPVSYTHLDVYKRQIVVCSNGGAQRGHTVLKSDGTRHVFHHFGSGTLNGADTYLPEDFILKMCIRDRTCRGSG